VVRFEFDVGDGSVFLKPFRILRCGKCLCSSSHSGLVSRCHLLSGDAYGAGFGVLFKFERSVIFEIAGWVSSAVAGTLWWCLNCDFFGVLLDLFQCESELLRFSSWFCVELSRS
jgi:hypothetical protein